MVIKRPGAPPFTILIIALISLCITPVSLGLVGGTALLAAACDRLISGAGRYPWLAVAGIYAVPVGWNLVVIAGHTGFHTAPGIVYALVIAVAIVCVVWVWQNVIARVRYRKEVR